MSMHDPLGSLWAALRSRFVSSSPVVTQVPQNEGPIHPGYSSYPPLIGRTGHLADRAQGTGQTGVPDIRATGFATPGYVSDVDYEPGGHNYAPRNNRDHLIKIPRQIPVGDDGRKDFGAAFNYSGPHNNRQADNMFTQNRSAPAIELYEFPAGWRNLVAPQYPAVYNLYQAIQLSRPLIGQDYLLGYAIPPGQATRYGQNGPGLPLGGGL